MKAIGEIKEELSLTKVEILNEFIEKYSSDERNGVKNLLISAQRKLQKFEVEKQRTYEMYSFERMYEDKTYVAGIDEVGRGPLAGPVVTCCLILPKDYQIFYLNDSKKLSAAKRDELYDVLLKEAVSYSIGIEDNNVIDSINILQATYKAMQQAVNNIEIKPEQLLVDAVTIPGISIPQQGIIKGDAKSASIAAASIVAKVTRDRMMDEFDKIFPQYGFASNKGYGTEEHINALKKYGPCPIHRKTFIKSFCKY